ncbi:MBL fold metallo-hydrolase [Niallia endozanthoxylica]|uniref:MBL fold metallo-hydrolase n=1 Tax=Niallia endozanthoxylica TaxID=2036016 RepID=A0A5J5I7F0_9BACI|nr:MBL fold metallo-hydrolase [Niallia endozanthoxylica]KAA9031730.1 MBL fold metallo-hydrolase [Niallia endozanthoxylica]
MKITVIGPWGGYPKANEASAGYLLEHEGFRLLIDCGSGVLSKLQTIVEPEKLDAVVISHYHSDHIADIGVLQHARLIQGFLGKEMNCLPIYAHPFNQQEFSKLTYKNITKGVSYQENDPLEIGPFTLGFIRTKHPVECFAIRFEAEGKAIVYTADTAFINEMIPFSSNADLLLCECNFYANQDGAGAGHMTSRYAGKLAKEANVKQLVLTHLPHYGRLEQLQEEAAEIYSGPIQLAHSGLSVTV